MVISKLPAIVLAVEHDSVVHVGVYTRHSYVFEPSCENNYFDWIIIINIIITVM